MNLVSNTSRQTQPFLQSTITYFKLSGKELLQSVLKTPIFTSRKLLYHKRYLGNFLSRKRTYMLIAELCLPLQWLMLLYSYKVSQVVITTVVSMDIEKSSHKRLWKAPKQEFCYMNVWWRTSNSSSCTEQS